MSVETTVAGIMSRYGIPYSVWWPIMQMESSGDPQATAITPEEYSMGLFQINVTANPQYRGMDLYDPATNAEIAARDFLTPAYAYASTMFAKPEDVTAYVYENGIRPYWTQAKETKVKGLTAQAMSQPAGQVSVGDWYKGKLSPLENPDPANGAKPGVSWGDYLGATAANVKTAVKQATVDPITRYMQQAGDMAGRGAFMVLLWVIVLGAIWLMFRPEGGSASA